MFDVNMTNMEIAKIGKAQHLASYIIRLTFSIFRHPNINIATLSVFRLLIIQSRTLTFQHTRAEALFAKYLR